MFARPPDEITRDPVPVTRASCADEVRAIREPWPWVPASGPQLTQAAARLLPEE